MHKGAVGLQLAARKDVNPISRLGGMTKPVAFYTPEQAAEWLGISVRELQRGPFRKCQVSPRIVRYPSDMLEEDLAKLTAPDTKPGPDPEPQREWRPKRPSTTVYVLRARPSGKIKIGRTRELEKRIATLQTGTWEFLELLLTIPDDRNLEAKLHRRFQADCIAGEWYNPSPRLLGWLAEQGAEL
jgi:hypothetical protein